MKLCRVHIVASGLTAAASWAADGEELEVLRSCKSGSESKAVGM